MKYRDTHVSTFDGSPAMVLFIHDNKITLINEDGFSWTDPVNHWEEID